MGERDAGVAQENAAVKDVEGKLRWEFIPWDTMEEVVRAFQVGADGRPMHDWMKGQSWGHYFGAVLRHSFSWWRGSREDKKTRVHPLAHAIASLLILMWYEENDVGTDDRAFQSPDNPAREVLRSSGRTIRVDGERIASRLPGDDGSFPSEHSDDELERERRSHD